MAVVEGTRRRNDVGSTTHDLYRQYGKQIYAYCFHRLRSREEAEDAVQTTFMNAFRALQRGAETQFEQAWLFKIAHNVCIARSTSSARRLKLEAPNDFEVLQEIVPAQGSERPVELIGVEEALEGMPENQRRAILLREWQGLSYREIGEELNLSQAAVEMLIFRARRALAGALEQPGEKKRRKVGRKVGALGSILGALKTLLGGGTAIKAAAVVAATAIAVVGESAQHTIVRHVSAPLLPAAGTATAKKTQAAAAATTRSRSSSVHSAVSAGVAEPSRAVVTAAPAHHLRTSHVSAKPKAQRASTAPAPAPAAAPAATTVAAAAVAPPPPPTPAPAVTTTAEPVPPAPTVTTTAAAPPAPESTRHGGNGKAKRNDTDDRNIAQAPPPPPVTTTTTTTTATTTSTAATPAPADPQPDQGNGGDHGHGHGHGNGHNGGGQMTPPIVVVPAPVAPAATTTTATTTTTDATVTATTPAPPEPQPDPGHGHGHGHGNGH
jgi:RNA polymerase sigma factor (sigma-70 family)